MTFRKNLFAGLALSATVLSGNAVSALARTHTATTTTTVTQGQPSFSSAGHHHAGGQPSFSSSANTAPVTAAPVAAAPIPAQVAPEAAPAQTKGSWWHGSAASPDAPATAPAAPAAPVVQPPPGAVPAFTGREYIDQAKIGLEDARRAALKSHTGTVTNSTLAPDKSGKLVYTFKVGGSSVYVDANSGEVLSTQ